ncbi:outer membrane protein assembly factor BamC [Pseudoalteromonas sp. S3776]|uniref:Outer membrane protein assembly factor BamC n=1 Tax=Pseudoalteromonas undina TaxID=43660 RepID=A0ACC6R933_9GAMM|nr:MULTISPECIES: outer membrane protein assembly factor BamC [unclassified Pseudoalteromonas]KPZ52881.1 Outer membrane protein assembly factor BamC precursor [Pseudoalteromonas sp. P1-25]KPZ53885.1 Outer membrane protein assembly factor BamC precursor [Pseudoalteromonas sp. P1-13-1a]KPZ55019.1 Outer membrane protein assembly factor BamC precursor [Pseudoalteromonas sp. P1-7a]TMO73155.1 outer membrane protein assembly factor BamC [Pseudoalteromonas sp. S3785]TMO79368.1 outer membrane protein as
MQYWIPKALAVSVLVSLSGCNVFINEAHNERNYRTHEGVKTPPSLSQPAQDPVYKMDVGQYDNNPEATNYRPPAQVLTVAKGSWVEEGDKQARIYFDKNDGIVDLDEFVWDSIKAVIAENNATTTKEDKLLGIIETDWYAIIKAEESWLWDDEVSENLERFRFTIEEKSHQRTASLRAELIDFKGDDTLTDLLKQQLEVRALNQVVAEFDYRYRQLEVENRKRQGIISLEMGFDNKGNAALVTEQSYDAVFDRFSGFLERLSFTIVEIKTDTGLITADYNKPESSVWDSIWGDDVAQLPIEEGQYQILVSKTKEGGTSLTWMDDKGETLEPGTMNGLQQALEAALIQRGIKI